MSQNASTSTSGSVVFSKNQTISAFRRHKWEVFIANSTGKSGGQAKPWAWNFAQWSVSHTGASCISFFLPSNAVGQSSEPSCGYNFHSVLAGSLKGVKMLDTSCGGTFISSKKICSKCHH